MTSQGIAAWTLARWGSSEQRRAHLPGLSAGELAAVAFSEAEAGSDLSAMAASLSETAGGYRLDGEKVWVTGAAYADLVLVFCRFRGGHAAPLVPAGADGVEITPMPDPLGFRAAGHARVRLHSVAVDPGSVLPGAGDPFGLMVQSALSWGRLSVAWGCLGLIRSCLAAAAAHAAARFQFGVPIAQHQLVARQLGDMFVAEQLVAHGCAHAARCWDESAAEAVSAVLVAKHFGAGQAAVVAAAAMQCLASAGAADDHPVARAYRDAKLLEIIEGSNEMCQLQLGAQAVAEWA